MTANQLHQWRYALTYRIPKLVAADVLAAVSCQLVPDPLSLSESRAGRTTVPRHIHWCVVLATLLNCAPATVFGQGAPQAKPFLMADINIGGMTPTGSTRDSFGSSFMIGGGLNFPIGRYVQVDALGADFSFGTAGPSRLITVQDNTRRRTRNYQLLGTTGLSFNVPVSKSGELSFGGGYSFFGQTEYGVGQSSGSSREQIACYSCFNTTYGGYYLVFKVAVREPSRAGAALTARYYEGSPNQPTSSLGGIFRNKQRWLTIGATFTFRILKS